MSSLLSVANAARIRLVNGLAAIELLNLNARIVSCWEPLHGIMRFYSLAKNCGKLLLFVSASALEIPCVCVRSQAVILSFCAKMVLVSS